LIVKPKLPKVSDVLGIDDIVESVVFEKEMEPLISYGQSSGENGSDCSTGDNVDVGGVVRVDKELMNGLCGDVSGIGMASSMNEAVDGCIMGKSGKRGLLDVDGDVGDVLKKKLRR